MLLISTLYRVMPTGEPSFLDEEEIVEGAKLYRKETARPLTDYQKRINEEAGKIALKRPSLIQKGCRNILLQEARETVVKTYPLKKGK